MLLCCDSGLEQELQAALLLLYSPRVPVGFNAHLCAQHVVTKAIWWGWNLGL